VAAHFGGHRGSADLLGGDEAMARARQPQVCSDAAYAVLTRPARSFAGRSPLCEDVLFASGVTDLSAYDCAPNSELQLDFWVAGPYPHH
jgi:citronellol/citronellal dehydrogenase